MNLVSLEYFLTNKTQNMDLNALFAKKIETIFFAMTRYSLLYRAEKAISEHKDPSRIKSALSTTIFYTSLKRAYFAHWAFGEFLEVKRRPL